MSFARGPLTPAQQELVDLVKTGYQTAMDTANAGIAQYKKARESQIKKFDAMRQEKGDDAVEESQYDLVRNFYYPVAEVAKTVDKVFKKGKRVMPHTLGHGIGLECHESPRLSSAQDNDWTLRPGMIVTLEPGLYDAEAGGVRWENDFLVRDDGIEQLTQSGIVEM
jgi:Xaa-Pro aminopeptidase